MRVRVPPALLIVLYPFDRLFYMDDVRRGSPILAIPSLLGQSPCGLAGHAVSLQSFPTGLSTGHSSHAAFDSGPLLKEETIKRCGVLLLRSTTREGLG